VIILSGFLMVDISAVDLAALPRPGELLYWRVSANPGGHPDNIALTLARLGHPGDDLAVVGAVGNDAFAELIRRALSSFSVKALFQEVAGSTGKTVILKEKGKDRAFIADPGANSSLSLDFLAEAVKELSPSIFYLASGILGEVDARLPEAYAAARKAGAITFGDLVRPQGLGWDYVAPAFPFIDVFHVNADEAAQITGFAEPAASASAISRAGVKLALVSEEGGVHASWDYGKKVVFQEGFKVNDVVDTTAAGDALVAGFIEKTSKGGLPSTVEQIEDYLDFAQATAAVKCTGVSTSAVSASAVNELLAQRDAKKKSSKRRIRPPASQTNKQKREGTT